jgi:hypothetical protein
MVSMDRPLLTRRSAAMAGAAGVLSLIAARPTRAFADTPPTSPIPTLPGEVSRTATRTSRIGKKPFETIDVVQNGDRARLYVPWTAALKGQKPGAAVWYYHSDQWDHTAMDNTYAYDGMLCVDKGVVSICPTYGGGSTWTSKTAIDLQKSWAAWMKATFSIGTAFSRANSGGGPLMIYAYAKGLIPALRGIYLANAAYDVEDLYARAPFDVGPAYNDDPVAIAATNPARIGQAAWTGKRMKAIVSTSDLYVPPDVHGLALLAKAQPVAADTQVRYHDLGHDVPSWIHTDMMSTFAGWA